ncbi:hypothetical protein [Herbaspirillum aquaticum]|uniref:hypothetical protein n=1 Tax=Herbaspirillum aquaticum TaxID=568783 RepID=UPI001F4D7D55
MKNLKIGHRLGLGFAAVLVLLVAVATFGLQQVSRLNDRIVFLTSIDEGKLEALSKVQFAVGLRAIAARNRWSVGPPNRKAMSTWSAAPRKRSNPAWPN